MTIWLFNHIVMSFLVTLHIDDYSMKSVIFVTMEGVASINDVLTTMIWYYMTFVGWSLN